MDNLKTEDQTSKVLVIGIGNEFRCDDGIGLHVARRLRKLNLSNVKVIEKSGEGAQLIDLWKGETDVIVIDATSSGSEPGTIHRLAASERKIPSKFFHYSTHNFSVAEAIELARTMKQLPKNLLLYGIEGRDFSRGVEITPVVQKAGEYVVDLILEEVKIYRKSVSLAQVG